MGTENMKKNKNLRSNGLKPELKSLGPKLSQQVIRLISDKPNSKKACESEIKSLGPEARLQ